MNPGTGWYCKHCGQKIGEVKEKMIGNLHRHTLTLVTPAFEVQGLARIKCPKCGRWRTWEQSRAMMEKYMPKVASKLPEEE